MFCMKVKGEEYRKKFSEGQELMAVCSRLVAPELDAVAGQYFLCARFPRFVSHLT